MVIMVIFVLIVGLGASLTRACLAMVINSIARYYGRSMQKLRLIIFVAGLSLLLSPLQFLELGWQYSFLAYIGIVIVAPIFESFLYGNKRSGVIIGALLQSFSAQLLCLPISLYNFGSFSVVGLITGVILSPTMAPLMLLIVASIASQSFGILAAMLLKLHVVIIQKTASFSWASISLVANASIFLLYIPIVLIVAIMYGNNRVHSLAKSEKYGKIYSC